jgi:hypothetical protein
MLCMIEKIIGLMSRVITKCHDDEYYTIFDNFPTNYILKLVVGALTNLYLIAEKKIFINLIVHIGDFLFG